MFKSLVSLAKLGSVLLDKSKKEKEMALERKFRTTGTSLPIHCEPEEALKLHNSRLGPIS